MARHALLVTASVCCFKSRGKGAVVVPEPRLSIFQAGYLGGRGCSKMTLINGAF